ncbi:MAG TPA: phospholipase D-like domain-containing protein [Anaerolineales bacterium]|nr:phospholipase D-like domain-containing protein [Anaerolineales bacterium]
MIFLRRPALAPIATLTLIALLAAFYILSKGRETDQARPGSITLPEIDLAVYFTDPSGPNAETLRGGPDAALALAIDSARYSVDVAVYQLNLWSVRDALLRAHRRGLRVRLVTDSDNILEAEIGEIQAAGIAILGDRRESLMHHKFVVIDQLEVWTGSMNLTVSDAYRNNNHLLRLQSSTLADDYTREFEEMFLEDRFGALSLPDTPHPQVEVAGVMVEVYFSPDDGVAARLVERIRGAQRSVHLLAFSFTSQEITSAIQERAAEGVEVWAVLEASQAAGIGSQYEPLQAGGAQVRLDGNRHNMHHKVIIIDEMMVILGSYNFTRSAETQNDENLLIIHDPALAEQFLAEFARVFAEASP